MKKVVLTYSSGPLATSVFEFLRALNEQQPLFVSAVFLTQLVYASVWSDASGLGVPVFLPVSDQDDKELKQAVKQFEQNCQQHQIAYQVHKDYTALPQEEILRETRFADVLVMRNERFYESISQNELSPLLREVLHGTECPVVVVPEAFSLPDKNLLFYDGSASSAFAIKQFAYLFPELCSNETQLIYTKADKDEHLPHERQIQEITAQHFSNLKQARLHLHAKDELKAWIAEQPNAMLVSGAFGRSGFSQLLHKSFMHELIGLHKYPVFIAHK